MKEENEWSFEGFWLLRIALRIIFAITAVSIIIWVFYNLSSGPSCQPMLFPNLGWELVGIFTFAWLLSWTFRTSRHNGYWHEERILRRRYARGEMTEIQFKKMMKTLHKNGQ